MNLLKTNSSSSSSEVTTLTALIRCTKNGTDHRLGMAVTLVVLSEFSSGGQKNWTGPVNSAKGPFKFTNLNHCPSLAVELSPLYRTVCPPFLVTTNEHHSPSYNRHLCSTHSLYQLVVIFQIKSLL